jgi:hypothetical protein
MSAHSNAKHQDLAVEQLGFRKGWSNTPARVGKWNDTQSHLSWTRGRDGLKTSLFSRRRGLPLTVFLVLVLLVHALPETRFCHSPNAVIENEIESFEVQRTDINFPNRLKT